MGNVLWRISTDTAEESKESGDADKQYVQYIKENQPQGPLKINKEFPKEVSLKDTDKKQFIIKIVT